jgi:hypothetical protein
MKKNILKFVILTHFTFLSVISFSQQITANTTRERLMQEIPINIVGASKLDNGQIFIELPKDKSTIYEGNFCVILTCLGSWTALYVKEINEKGFVVKSESGDLNAKFFWQISPITSTEEKK